MWYINVSSPLRQNSENLANETRELVRDGTKMVELQLRVDTLLLDSVTTKSETDQERVLASL